MPVLYTECLAGCFPGHIESTMFCLQVISDRTMFGKSLTKSEYMRWNMSIQTCYSFQDWWHNHGPLQSATVEHHSIQVQSYSYNKSQQDALFLNFISVKNSTCFGQIYCPSSGVLILYSQQLVFVKPKF